MFCSSQSIDDCALSQNHQCDNHHHLRTFHANTIKSALWIQSNGDRLFTYVETMERIINYNIIILLSFYIGRACLPALTLHIPGKKAFGRECGWCYVRSSQGRGCVKLANSPSPPKLVTLRLLNSEIGPGLDGQCRGAQLHAMLLIIFLYCTEFT